MKPAQASAAKQLSFESSIKKIPADMNGLRAIEDASFPFEHLSEIAELESWCKEVNRPVYHLHKWWAQRLGSVSRPRCESRSS